MGDKFEMVSAIFICMNAILIGVAAQWQLETRSTDAPITFVILEWIINVVFTLELAVRIAAEGSFFCSKWNKNRGWNFFDSFVVTIAYVTGFMSQFDLSSLRQVSVLRTFRTLRLLRAFKVLRVVRVFNVLRTMIAGIISSIRPLMWAMLLLFIIKYVFAVCLLQMIADDLANVDAHVQDALLHDYGTISKATYTLYKAITGGTDWGDAAAPLEQVLGGIPAFMLCIYVAFFLFCVLNVLTGIFVESANKLIQQDDDRMAIARSDKRSQNLRNIVEIFNKMAGGKGAHGRMYYDNFETALDDIRVQTYLEQMGLEVATCGKRELFSLLDVDGNGYIDTNEFTVGVEHLQGYARSHDIYALKKRQHILSKTMLKIMDKIDAVGLHLGVNTAVATSSSSTAVTTPHSVVLHHDSNVDLLLD